MTPSCKRAAALMGELLQDRAGSLTHPNHQSRGRTPTCHHNPHLFEEAGLLGATLTGTLRGVRVNSIGRGGAKVEAIPWVGSSWG